MSGTNAQNIGFVPLEEIASHCSSFSQEKAGVQIFWDSTSLGNFKTCPQLYFLHNVQGFATSTLSPDLSFGLAWHSAIERYHRLCAQSLSHEDALFWTVAETWWCQLFPSHEEFIDPTRTKPEKTAHVLIRALVAYLDTFGHRDNLFTLILPSGKPAVEVSFSFPLTLENFCFHWCGHLDRVVTTDAPLDLREPLPAKLPPLYVSDYKTTTSALDDRYWSQWSMDLQMSGYTLAANIIFPVSSRGVIVDAAQLSVTGQQFARGIAGRSPSQIEDFLSDLELDIATAEFFAAQQRWPHNPKSCIRYGRACEFLHVCTLAPALRERFLESNFTRRWWNPRTNRI